MKVGLVRLMNGNFFKFCKYTICENMAKRVNLTGNLSNMSRSIRTMMTPYIDLVKNLLVGSEYSSTNSLI